MGRFLDCVAVLNPEELRRLDQAQTKIEQMLLKQHGILHRPENWVVVALELMAGCVEERLDQCQEN